MSTEKSIKTKKYCNRYYYTDVEPYEVLIQPTEKSLLIRKMNCVLEESSIKALKDSFVVGGFCGHTDNSKQKWIITPNDKEPILKVRLHSNGYYYLPHDKGTRFKLEDEPYKWYDYNY